MSIGGGSPFLTAGLVLARPVSDALAREWGEALWTAPDLADRAFQATLRASVGWLLGLPMRATPEQTT